MQRDDVSMPNLVASGLFGDGAAAVVAAGGGTASRGGRAAAEVLASRSRLYPDSERTMGFDVGSAGLRIVLDAEVPDDGGPLPPRATSTASSPTTGSPAPTSSGGSATRAAQGDRGDPGGPRACRARRVQLTWDSLARIGNLSSASVLHVLEDTLRERPAAARVATASLLAMGPGFCSELCCCARPPATRGRRMTGLVAFTVLVALVGLERLAELVVSTRNAAWSFARGGVETGQRPLPGDGAAAHRAAGRRCWSRRGSGGPTLPPLLAWSMLALVLASQALRWWCIATLGRHWNTRVIIVPGLAPVASGPTACCRTPTTSRSWSRGSPCPWCTRPGSRPLVFTVANAALLTVRIRVENAALAALPRPGTPARRCA